MAFPLLRSKSQTQVAPTENQDPLGKLRAVAKSLVSGVTAQPRRALGDISNVTTVAAGNSKLAMKKKELAPILTNPTSLAALAPPAPVAPPAPSAPASTSESHSFSSIIPARSESVTESMHSIPESPADIAMEPEDGKDEEFHITIDNGVEFDDRNDPQVVADYVNDIMRYFKASEHRRHPSTNYMEKQKDINAKMREILIDWLIEVHLKFKLQTETLYLTVNLIDRFLERRAVKRTKLQLVGCTCMLIACKYEEVYPPAIKDFVYITDSAYSKEQIIAMEGIILDTLKFNLTLPSAYRFAQRYCKIAGNDATLVTLTNYFMETTLQEYHFLKFLPSRIAAAALYLSLHTLSLPGWNATLEAQTGYKEDDLKACVREIYIAVATEKQKCRALRKKFLHPKFGNAAKIPLSCPPLIREVVISDPVLFPVA